MCDGQELRAALAEVERLRAEKAKAVTEGYYVHTLDEKRLLERVTQLTEALRRAFDLIYAAQYLGESDERDRAWMMDCGSFVSDYESFARAAPGRSQ